MAKFYKDSEATRQFNLNKVKEKYNASLSRKNQLDVELRHKCDDMNSKLQKRQARAKKQAESLLRTETMMSRGVRGENAGDSSASPPPKDSPDKSISKDLDLDYLKTSPGQLSRSGAGQIKLERLQKMN